MNNLKQSKLNAGSGARVMETETISKTGLVRKPQRSRKNFYTVLIAAMLMFGGIFASCEKDEPEIPEEAYLEVEVDEENTPSFVLSSPIYEGGFVIMKVTSNVSWQVSSDVSWVSASPASGKKDGSFTLTIAENASQLSRKGTLTVTGGGITKSFNVRQVGAPYTWRYEESVTINGIRWATRNVAVPGTFASTPADAGMFYQWNRKIGWSSTDPLMNTNGGTTWDSSTPSGTTWNATNDPSPSGYRVPTKAEFETLLDNTKVNSVWATQNGISGRKFTDQSSGNSIFLPAAGSRNALSAYNGALFQVGTYVTLWSSTHYDYDEEYNNNWAWSYGSDSDGYNILSYNVGSHGKSVRPVKE